MKIDWKHLATTVGYKSLKAAYINGIKRSFGTKAEEIRQFQWVINRAKHYAHHTGASIESILNLWEKKRDYSWQNYYQNSNQPKFHSGAKDPMGVDGYRESCKKANYSHVSSYVSDFIKRKHKKDSTKKKQRWPMARKQRG